MYNVCTVQGVSNGMRATRFPTRLSSCLSRVFLQVAYDLSLEGCLGCLRHLCGLSPLASQQRRQLVTRNDPPLSSDPRQPPRPQRASPQRVGVPHDHHPPPRARQRHVGAAGIGQEADATARIGADRREEDDLLFPPLEAVDSCRLGSRRRGVPAEGARQRPRLSRVGGEDAHVGGG